MVKRIVTWLVAIVVLFGLLGFAYQRLKPHAFHGMVLQSPKPAPDFTLVTEGGKEVSLKDFRGKIVLLYFGYTFCPDVCPTTMRELARAMEILGEKKAQKVQVIMISVDSERDTPEVVAEYARNFYPTFIGVTGTLDQIAQVATMYGIYFKKNEGTAATGYLVDHTATVTVINQEGYIKLIFPYGTPAKDIADDLAYMLR